MTCSSSSTQNAGAPASYLVGQDADGRWLAVEEHGRGGGLFVSKAAALGFVSFETGHDPRACHLAPGPIVSVFSAVPAARPARRGSAAM